MNYVLIYFLPLIACLIALGGGIFTIHYSRKWKLIDKPNHRSSHHRPTPKGGGIGLVIAGSLTGLLLGWQSNWVVEWGVLAISCVLAGVGLRDDLRAMPASLRLGIHTLMGAGLLFALDGMPEVQRFVGAPLGRTVTYIFLLLVIVWWINLFNFMDGIDGMAGAQAVFMLLSGAVLLGWSRPDVVASPTWIWMLCIAGAVGGFLFLNWDPARIFMGDVGSIYLSFMVVSLALLSIQNDWVPVLSGLAMWAILGAAFVVDATITLFTRMVIGERWYDAHRNHVYQRLSRRFGRHLPVTLLFMTVNVVWLLPLAAACVFWPQGVLIWTSLAYLPLVVLAIVLGAGKADAASLTGAV